jgi:transposase
VASVSHLAPIHLGLDVHRDTISVGILEPDQQVPAVDRIPTTSRRCAGSLPTSVIRVGCEPATRPDRLAMTWPGCCTAWASAARWSRRLVPRAPGDKVKTDKRDCRRLARLHRAGELVAIRIPSPTEEAVRDLCRTRADMVADRTRARHQLGKFLLRHGRTWRYRLDPRARTLAAGPAVRRARACCHLRPLPGGAAIPRRPVGRHRGRPCRLVRPAAVRRAGRPLERLPGRHPAGRAHVGCRGRRLAPVRPGEPVHGVLRAGAQRVFQRPADRSWHLTKAGNAHLRAQLVESAWSYQHRPGVGTQLAGRQQGLDPQVVARAWAAQLRLCGRFRRLAARKTSKNVVVAAIARELAGFLWAEVTA